MKTAVRFISFMLLSLGATTATGVIFELRRRKLLKKLLEKAANEGYETAYDINNPDIHGLRQKNKHLKYGPTINPSFIN